MATTAHELDDMTNVDLETKLREAKEELFNLRFQAATGQLESHGRLRTVKRDIARIYTVVRERELGIRSTPGDEDSADGAACTPHEIARKLPIPRGPRKHERGSKRDRDPDQHARARPRRPPVPQGPGGARGERQDGEDRHRLRRGPRQARAVRQG